MSFYKTLRHDVGTVIVSAYDFGDIFVTVRDESDNKILSGESCICLTPKKARKLAKAIKRAARLAEAAR